MSNILETKEITNEMGKGAAWAAVCSEAMCRNSKALRPSAASPAVLARQFDGYSLGRKAAASWGRGKVCPISGYRVWSTW